MSELGYDVTLVRDATASFTEEEMHEAPDITPPNYGNAIVKTSEIVEVTSSANSSDSLTGDTSRVGSVSPTVLPALVRFRRREPPAECDG